MTSPIILAFIGTVAALILYNLCNKVENRFLRGIFQLASIFSAMAVMAAMSPDNKTASLAGQYFFFMIIITAVLTRFFGRAR